MYRLIFFLISFIAVSLLFALFYVTPSENDQSSLQSIKAITTLKTSDTKQAPDKPGLTSQPGLTLHKAPLPSTSGHQNYDNKDKQIKLPTEKAPKTSKISIAKKPDIKNTPVDCDKIDNKSNNACTPAQTSNQDTTELTTTPAKFELLGHSFVPGEKKRLGWSAGQSFAGGSIDTPVLVINGAHPGPKLCLTAAVHGDELNGVEIVLRLVNSIKPKELNGTLIAVPIVNILGLTRGSRYLPDRRDLNRYFPGTTDGSAASRIAYLFFEKVIKHCHYLVDFHTGSGKRTNLPQLRADLNNPDVYQFSRHFGATAVLHHTGNPGMLRRAANDAGIPAVTFELGEPGTLQIKHVDYGIAAIETLMEKLNMIKRFRLWSEPQPQFYNSTWVRTNDGGVLISKVKLGDTVSKNDKLGWVSNPISNERIDILATINGRVLGMALNQFVLPGFAAYHIGVQAKKTSTAPQPDEVMSNNTDQIPSFDEPIAKQAKTIKQELLSIPDPDDPTE